MSVSETLSDLQKKIENPYKRSLEMVSPFDFWSNVSGDRANKEFHNYKPTTVKSILGGVDGSILDTYGGEYEWDVFKVKLWQARGSDRNVHIRYGKNMTQYKQDESSNTVYTAVKPFWYKEQTNNGNKTYTLVELEDTADTPDKCVLIVNEPKYSKVLLLDMTSAFDDAPSISDLKDLTDQYIAAHQLTSPEVTITVSFVNLENSKEYDDIKSLQEIRLCDIVHVDFPRYNSFRSVKCEKTEYNVLAQRYDSITLGTIKTYLPGTISKQSQDIQNGVTKDEFAEAIAKT
jgi:phage minor structural protein